MTINPVEQLKRLATSDQETARQRYAAICNQRDAVLTRAVTAAARQLLEASGYHGSGAGRAEHQRAVALIEDHLAQSSIPEIDQRLLALVGSGALAGWVLMQPMSEEAGVEFQPYHSGRSELDPAIVHRLARALHRSPDHDARLQAHIAASSADLAPDDAALIAASIEGVLAEISVGELDDSVENAVIDSILGG